MNADDMFDQIEATDAARDEFLRDPQRKGSIGPSTVSHSQFTEADAPAGMSSVRCDGCSYHSEGPARYNWLIKSAHEADPTAHLNPRNVVNR